MQLNVVYMVVVQKANMIRPAAKPANSFLVIQVFARPSNVRYSGP